MLTFSQWLERIDRSRSDYDPDVINKIVTAYRSANGADNLVTLGLLLKTSAPEVVDKIRRYYEEYAGFGNPRAPTWPKRGETDPLDRTVERTYIATDRYVIYSTRDPDFEELCGLRHMLAGGFEECKALRDRLATLKPDIAAITDAVCSVRPMIQLPYIRRKGGHEYRMFRERICELVAQAMSSAFEDRLEQGKAILAETRAVVEERRDSLNRMRYISSNALCAAGVLAFGTWLIATGAGAALVPQVTVGTGQTISVVPVLIAGALGAFFSVSISLRQLRVDRSITLFEMFYAGFVRVPIGVIAAAAVVWMIQGGWILSSVDAKYLKPSIFLFAFLAGFSEMFVPNALNQVQDQTKARRPGAEG